jgi:cell wall-associated NlpC family hydrolase
MRKGFVCLLAFIILVSCAAYPAYRPPGQRPERKPIPATKKSKINKQKMGYIIDSYLGTPYREKGSSRLGIDCSGLVMETYKRYSGINLPHDTKKLHKLVKKIKKKNLLYGDLVFFSFDSHEVSHVGIYIGEDKFVHSSRSQGVIISSLEEKYYSQNYVGARRVIP